MKIWTMEELTALKERYPVEPNSELAKEFQVAVKQLRGKAHHIGLTKAGPVKRNHIAKVWTEAEDEELRKGWADVTRRVKGHNADWLAHKLRVSTPQLRHRASVLNLRQCQQKTALWSDEEIELLDRYLHQTPRRIRYHLERKGFHRTESAIIVQRYRKLGGLALASGSYSCTQLAECLGVSPTKVMRWIRLEWLKATPRGDSLNQWGGPGDRWMISPKAVRTFITDHPELIAPFSGSLVWLVDLLTNRKAD